MFAICRLDGRACAVAGAHVPTTVVMCYMLQSRRLRRLILKPHDHKYVLETSSSTAQLAGVEQSCRVECPLDRRHNIQSYMATLSL